MSSTCLFPKQQIQYLLDLADAGIRGSDMEDAMNNAHADAVRHAHSCQPCADAMQIAGILVATQQANNPHTPEAPGGQA